MAIKFVNIGRKINDKFEEAIADTEPKITALWSTSDRSPNITQGQDMGWRLAPEVVVELKKIKQDGLLLERIAARYKKALEDIREPDILQWISDKTAVEEAPIATEDDYKDEYDESIKALERPAATTTEATTDVTTQAPESTGTKIPVRTK